ncbi:MAG: ribosomal protein L7/L12 [Xanthobacteraceae bacterium]|nr:ribosomal protein L7/L12 [Xanthobacteraceae bacterium]
MRIRPCSVILTDAGRNRIAVMAAVRKVRSDLSLREVKVLLDNLPQVILEDVDAEEADRAARTLQDAGADGRTDKPDLRANLRDWLQNRCTIAEIKAAHDTGKTDDEQTGDENPARLRVWQELEQQMQPGDEIWSYSSPPVFWENMCGRGGYAVVRNGEIVYTVLTAMN